MTVTLHHVTGIRIRQVAAPELLGLPELALALSLLAIPVGVGLGTWLARWVVG